MFCRTAGNALVAVSVAFAFVGAASGQPAGELENLKQNQLLRQRVDSLRQKIDVETLSPQSAPSSTSPDPGEVSDPSTVQPDSSNSIIIKSIKFSRSLQSLGKPERLIFEKFLGQPASQSILEALRTEVINFLAAQHLVATVNTPNISFSGEMTVDVNIETLGRVEVEYNKSPLSPGWAIKIIEAAIRPGAVLRLDKLESAMLKLNDLGGVQARAKLSQSANEGQTNIILTLDKVDQLQGQINLNNETLPYTGPYQAQVYGIFESLFGRGEIVTLDASYSGNIDWYGSRSSGIDFSWPISPDGLQLIGSYAWADYRLLDQYISSNSVGNSNNATIGVSQPLWRRPKSNIDLSIIGEYGAYSQYQNGSPGSLVDVPVVRVSLQGNHQDNLFNGTGLNAYVLTISGGSTESGEDQVQNLLPYSAADYFKNGAWGKAFLVYNRYQSFANSNLSLELFAQAQVATGSLYSSEQFSLGWPNAVRAYSPGEAMGNAGASVQFTARYQVFGALALKGFVDAGSVWPPTEILTGDPVYGPVSLWGPGVGVELGTTGNYLISVDVAFPIGKNRYGSSGLDVDGNDPSARVWISVKKWL